MTEEQAVDRISTLFSNAKLREEDFLPETQVLFVTEDSLKLDRFTLIELDQHIVDSLKTEGSVVFKGAENDDLFLCTHTKTYEVRECETSNTLLLLPELECSKQLKATPSKQVTNRTVAGINRAYFEVNVTKPNFRQVLTILERAKYNGPENESEEKNAKLVSYEELFSRCQSSRKEFDQFLSKLDVVILDDKVRLFDLDYLFRVLSYVLKSADEHSWDRDMIDKEVTIEDWSRVVPKIVLEAVFDLYTDKSTVVEEGGKQFYKYKETEICVLFARVLLQYAGKFNLVDFLQAWRDSVPEGMETSEEMLAGVAIVDKFRKPNLIWAFSENNLPDSIPERFDKLFEAKSKWTAAEITPYIQSLATDKLDANALLAKYARISHENGQRIYCSKHIE